MPRLARCREGCCERTRSASSTRQRFVGGEAGWGGSVDRYTQGQKFIVERSVHERIGAMRATIGLVCLAVVPLAVAAERLHIWRSAWPTVVAFAILFGILASL